MIYMKNVVNIVFLYAAGLLRLDAADVENKSYTVYIRKSALIAERGVAVRVLFFSSRYADCFF
ncbi:hypothetical protein DSUL_50202 [Desulfovibrionales bacterium]